MGASLSTVKLSTAFPLQGEQSTRRRGISYRLVAH